MAETLIVDATNDGAHRSPFFNPFKDLDTPAPGEILCPIPANLDEEQIAFWRWFPPKVTSLGELRRKIGLTRREWYHPPDNLRYHKLANLSDHLQKEPERVKQLLEDDAAFLAYVATLRLQGA